MSRPSHTPSKMAPTIAAAKAISTWASPIRSGAQERARADSDLDSVAVVLWLPWV